jgi:hypothetical protein
MEHKCYRLAEDIVEFKGEYLGGHVNYPDIGPVLLQLNEESLFIAPYSPLSGTALGQPFLTIPFADITGVQSLPYEKISTLRFLALGAVAGLLWRKNEHILTISFKDESNIEQTVAFKLKNTAKVHAAVYERIAKPQNRKNIVNSEAPMRSIKRKMAMNRWFKVLLGVLAFWCLIPLILASYNYLFVPTGAVYFWVNLGIFFYRFGTMFALILLGASLLAYVVWRLRK